jgi:hypothetical protein
VIAYGVGASPSPDGPAARLASDGLADPEGIGSSVSSVVGRREGDTCIIWKDSYSNYRKVKNGYLL